MGKQSLVIYGRTYCEVKQRLIEKKNAVLQNTVITDKHPTVYNEVLDAWLNSSKINTKESTYARYTHLINSHIRPYLGNHPLSKISTQMVEGYNEQQLASG